MCFLDQRDHADESMDCDGDELVSIDESENEHRMNITDNEISNYGSLASPDSEPVNLSASKYSYSPTALHSRNFTSRLLFSNYKFRIRRRSNYASSPIPQLKSNVA